MSLVNHPSHYTNGTIECIDYLKDSMPFDSFIGFLEASAKKYLHRWRNKGGVEDLEKAQWYINRMVAELKSEPK